jgi:diaminopimelate decarboxylase
LHHFKYKNGELFCEDVPLSKIADEFDTPCYVYSEATLKRHFKAFSDPFQNVDNLICYSVKACSNMAVLKLFSNLGSGFDVVSAGELYRVIKAGGDPTKVVYSGVGKTKSEIEYALSSDILMFNIESEAELHAINETAKEMGKVARVSLRVNPAVDPKTHPYISTGLKEAKFGIHSEKAIEIYKSTLEMENTEAIGVDCHIGSQLTQTSPFVEAINKLTSLIDTLKKSGLNIKYLDLGGGLGITYDDERPPLPKEYADEILGLVKDLDVSLILEPGRVIVGNAAALVTRVLYEKPTDEKKFVIVDAAMNDCVRPSLYGAYHELMPVTESSTKSEQEIVDVVGPICESTDFLAKDRASPHYKAGDLIAVMSCGAYCSTMASNYNSRTRAPEVLVSGNETHLIRERETREDLVKGEKIPDFIKNA